MDQCCSILRDRPPKSRADYVEFRIESLFHGFKSLLDEAHQFVDPPAEWCAAVSGASSAVCSVENIQTVSVSTFRREYSLGLTNSLFGLATFARQSHSSALCGTTNGVFIEHFFPVVTLHLSDVSKQTLAR